MVIIGLLSEVVCKQTQAGSVYLLSKTVAKNSQRPLAHLELVLFGASLIEVVSFTGGKPERWGQA